MKGGLVWSDVIARVTADAVSGEIFDSELARDITRSLGPRDVQTILIFEASTVKSPSPILLDSTLARTVQAADDRKGQRVNADDERDAVGPRVVQHVDVEKNPAHCRTKSRQEQSSIMFQTIIFCTISSYSQNFSSFHHLLIISKKFHHLDYFSSVSCHFLFYIFHHFGSNHFGSRQLVRGIVLCLTQRS